MADSIATDGERERDIEKPPGRKREREVCDIVCMYERERGREAVISLIPVSVPNV